MVPDEHSPQVPGLARRMSVSSCRHDPAPVPGHGIPLDVPSGSGCSRPIPQHRAAPPRQAGAALTQDLHPCNRGPRGTHHGTVIANGSPYCPAAACPAGTRAAHPHRHPRTA